jgi:hypothetical protein
MPGNVRVVRHDAARDPMPEGPFDLIHARALLCHLPSRTDVLRRAARSVPPAAARCRRCRCPGSLSSPPPTAGGSPAGPTARPAASWPLPL